jgi:hypothetical protein
MVPGGVVLEYHVSAGKLDQALMNWFLKNVRARGGGNVQKAFGSTGR